jgi:hypothetical protein
MKGNHEMVTFYDIDFGETYRAGVAEFYKSDADLDTAAKASAVTRKHQIGEPIELVEESKVQTQFGEGSLRVYSMKGGALLREVPLGQKPQTVQYHDSYIAVLLVPHDGRIVITLSQDDYLGISEKVGDDAWKKALKGQVQALLATMTLGGGITSQTNLTGAPGFAKAEREFLDALALAQSFRAGDVRTADTPGRMADTYAEERNFDEAEARGKQAVASAPHQDQATLYFFNTSGWKVFPEKLTLLDNDKRIAALNREHYFVLPIAPGHHVLRPKDERPTRGSPKHEVDLDAKPGFTYYVAGGFSPDGYSFRWTFAEISKYEADKLLAEMKPQAQK